MHESAQSWQKHMRIENLIKVTSFHRCRRHFAIGYIDHLRYSRGVSKRIESEQKQASITARPKIVSFLWVEFDKYHNFSCVLVRRLLTMKLYPNRT